MIRKVFITVFCAAAMGLAARAQAPMTLHDCMEYAVSNSTKMRILEADMKDARIARRDALLALFLPSVNGGTSASYSFGRGIDPETNTYINTVSFGNGYSLSAGLTLFNGFSAVNNYKISQTSLKMGQTRERQEAADICLAVMEAYYNVVYYNRLCEVCEDQVAAAETSLHKARREEELGRKGHADVVEMEANLADQQYNLINTRNLRDNQLTTLSDLMFWPVDEELIVDTGMPGQAGHDGTGVTPDLIGGLSTESVVDFALTHNPKIQIADWTRLNAKRELNTAKWQTLPRISLSGSWSTSYYNYQGSQQIPYWDLLNRNRGYGFGMSVSIPIFNRLSTLSNISRKRSALARAEASYDQTLRDVESEVRRAIQDRDGAATAWMQAQRKAEVQEEAYMLNLKKLEQGLISPLEFQTAANNYLRAQADEMNSQFKYRIKYAVVQYYNGVDYLEQ